MYGVKIDQTHLAMAAHVDVLVIGGGPQLRCPLSSLGQTRMALSLMVSVTMITQVIR